MIGVLVEAGTTGSPGGTRVATFSGHSADNYSGITGNASKRFDLSLYH